MKKVLSVLLIFMLLFSAVYAFPFEQASAEKAEPVYEPDTYIPEEEYTEEIYEGTGSLEYAFDGTFIRDYVDNETLDEAGHVARINEEEALNTYVFLNRDGTKSVYYMDDNVRYVDENGETVEKDLTIIRKNKGYTLKANDVKLWFPDVLSDGISVKYDKYHLTLYPQGVADTEEVIIDEYERITYPGVFGENTVLAYTPTLSGLKEDIILSEYTGQLSYDFLIHTHGMRILEEEGKYIVKKPGNGNKETFELGAVQIYDSAGNFCVGEMKITEQNNGSKYILTLIAPEEFLTDPDTVYPVTIDPSITVSDNLNGANAIEDSVIYSGTPNSNYGGFTYLTVGYGDSTYGVGRAIFRLPGLYNSTEYQSLTGSQIVSVKFYAWDASGHDTRPISIYPATSSEWTESGVKWSNAPGYYTGNDTITAMTANMPSGAYACFDITTLIKWWKSGRYATADCGFIMKNPNETSDLYKKVPCSSETAITDRRPYVVMTYSTASSIISTVDNVPEGETITLSVTSDLAISSVVWSSNATTYATVSSTGVLTARVTGIKAGRVIISARVTYSNNDTQTLQRVIYVSVPNGVYYIQNNNSNYYLHAKNGEISNLTDVYQYSKYSSSTSDTYKIRQMWKTHYLSEGFYSIRPMHKLNMGLDVTNGNVDIYGIGTTDTRAGVADYAEWTIEWSSTGYLFKNKGDSDFTMQVKNSSTSVATTVIASSGTTGVSCRWSLSKISSPPSGAYWYDTNAKVAISGSSAGTKTIDCGSSSNISALGLVPVLYAPSSNNQTFVWFSENTNIATVNSNGLISAKNAGDVVITATSSYGSYKLLLNIMAKSLDPFHYHNIQYMRYVRITGTNWWGLGSDTDHTINIVKSTMYPDDYCIIHDNINTGYYREIYINDELKNTLNSLEAGYQEHHSWLPLSDTTTDQENAAHSSKGETDQLVEDGYFAEGSSEYYGVWAYNYISTLSLLDYWRGAIDTATAAYGVYLTATSFYYSYLMSTSTASMQVTSSQYSNTASILDDIDDAVSGMNYGDKTILSAEARNASLANEGFTNPLPYQPQTPVVKIQQTSSSQYVRVFTDGNQTGRWLMKYSDIQGLTPAQIQSKFALPSTPTHYCFVNVPAGTTVYIGVVNQSSVNGTLQYELGTIIPDTAFGTAIILP